MPGRALPAVYPAISLKPRRRPWQARILTARLMNAFRPRMNSQIVGFSVVGSLKWRMWQGVAADLWDVECVDQAGGTYVSPDPRLFVPLALEGGGLFLMGGPGEAAKARHTRPFLMSFVPAGLELAGEARELSRIRHLDLHFSEEALRSRFGRALPYHKLGEPRLAFEDERIASLARLIAEECGGDEARHDLYAQGLVNALLVLLFDIRPEAGRRRPALSRAQLRIATEFIDANCLDGKPRLADLAALVGLSETYFSHAFKAATGVPPHRWVMQVRIRNAQQLLASTDLSLSAVAARCGFSDQAHLTRVFKGLIGTTPAAWRQESLTRGA